MIVFTTDRRRSARWAVVYVSNPVLLGVIVMLSYNGLGCFTLFRRPFPGRLCRAARWPPPSGW